MSCTTQSYVDTIGQARLEVKRWREAGFPARHERVTYSSGRVEYRVLTGSFGDRYHKMKRALRKRGRLPKV